MWVLLEVNKVTFGLQLYSLTSSDTRTYLAFVSTCWEVTICKVFILGKREKKIKKHFFPRLCCFPQPWRCIKSLWGQKLATLIKAEAPSLQIWSQIHSHQLYKYCKTRQGRISYANNFYLSVCLPFCKAALLRVGKMLHRPNAMRQVMHSSPSKIQPSAQKIKNKNKKKNKKNEAGHASSKIQRSAQ